MAVYKGNARVVQASAGSTRSFVLRTDATASVAAGDLSEFTLTAGEAITLTYQSGTGGLTPPGAANTVIIRVYYETGTALLVRELYNGSAPATGTNFTFYATDTGLVGGSPRAGTLRLYVQAIRTDLGAYNINSDANGDLGVIRANAKVSNLTVSAYPAGATFSYGTAANENISLTATHTRPYSVRGHENLRLDALKLTAQQIAGTVKNIDPSTTCTQVFTSSNSFDDSADSYGAEITSVGVALLVPDSDTSMLWTTFVDDGANVEQAGGAVRRQSFYNVDPRYDIDAPVLGQSVYNRNKSAFHSFGITNARGESLTRSVTWNILDGNDDVVASVSDTGPTYSNTRATGNTESATNDQVGDQWTVITTLADAYNEAASIYSVARQWLMKASAGAAVGTVFTDKDESPTADGKNLFNRKEDVFFGTGLYDVNGDALGEVAGFFAPRRVDQEIYELSMVGFTLAAGGVFSGVNAKYEVPVASVISPAGRALVFSSDNSEQPRTGTGGVGNFAETGVGTAEWTITDFLEVEARLQLEATRNTDPEDTVFTIGSDAVYMLVNVLNAVGDPIDSAVVTKRQFDPVGIETATFQSTTGADGWTVASSFQPNTPKGEWLYRATVNYNGNTGTNDQLAQHVSAFTANKATSSGFGPVFNVPNTVAGRQTSKQGDFAKPGDLILVGVGFTENLVRRVITEVPNFQLAKFNQATKQLLILQSDYTWKAEDAVGYESHFFDYKENIDAGLEWIASFGTAGQGVTVDNGYVTGTEIWESGTVYTINRVKFEGQNFYTPAKHYLVGPSAQHPMDARDIPGSLVTPVFDPTGLFR
jgi:hypothetical protein